MKYIEVYKLQNNGDQKVVLKCFLNVAGQIDITGEGKQLAENLFNDGIKNYLSESPQTLFPKDGISFLENMKYNFTSGYLNASEIKES